MAKKKKGEDRRGRGQPTKLTPELQAKICQVLELCNVLEDAALFCGLSRTTVFMWMQKGREQGHGKYRDFFDAVETAKAKRRISINTQMIVHGKRHWQAMAWQAERTDPQHFGLRVKVQVNEELERMLDKLEQNLTPQEYERALQAIAQSDSSGEETFEGPGGESAGRRGLAAAVGAALESSLPEPDAS